MSKRSITGLLRDRKGATAIEFALIAPVFFFLIFGILEVALMVWFQTLLTEGADRAANSMREQVMAGKAVTAQSLRDSVCSFVSAGGLSCGTGLLKIAVIDASVPQDGRFPVPRIVENTAIPEDGLGDQYVIALGYNWGLALTTSKLLLPQGPSGSQIQGFAFSVTAERITE